MNQIVKFSANRGWRTYQGGKQLDTMEGTENPQDSSFPEDWIGSTVQARNVGREHVVEGLATVSDDAGRSILFRDLLEKDRLTFWARLAIPCVRCMTFPWLNTLIVQRACISRPTRPGPLRRRGLVCRMEKPRPT